MKMRGSMLDLVLRIARELDGTEWNADTCMRIAWHLRRYGYTIRETQHNDNDAEHTH